MKQTSIGTIVLVCIVQKLDSKVVSSGYSIIQWRTET